MQSTMNRDPERRKVGKRQKASKRHEMREGSSVEQGGAYLHAFLIPTVRFLRVQSHKTDL